MTVKLFISHKKYKTMKSEADTMEVERKELNDVEVPDKKLREYSINTLLKLELTENDIEKDFMNIKKNQFVYIFFKSIELQYAHK